MDLRSSRPARDEAAEYYFKYIDLVPAGDICRILDDQHRETLALLDVVDPLRASHAYAPGKWTIAEVVAHINDTERLFAMRAFWFARGHASPLPSFEPDDAAKAGRANERAWKTHVEEFDAIRRSTLALFRYLPADAWPRSGTASDMPFSVRSLAYIAAGHVIHHVAVLKERYAVS